MDTAEEPNVKYAASSCGTCRQQRIRCDRLLPVCRRCSNKRRKCQGYKRSKTLRWTNSIAIMGKLMGKTTFSPTSISPDSEGDVLMLENDAIYRSLIEPDLQDLSWECRKYIRYFDLELSNECVVYNLRSSNPFLALMPLIAESQALKHIMISISAFHLSYKRSVHDLDSASAGLNFPPSIPESRLHPDLCGPSYTALFHKQEALKCLKQEVASSSGAYRNGLTAAAVIFICLDVVESGGLGWKHHLKGAKELIRYGKTSTRVVKNEFVPWMEYFETACTTFDIMGSTLSRIKSPSSLPETLRPSFLEILQRSEDKTWVGCPAELLYSIAIIHSHVSSPSAPPCGLKQTTIIRSMLKEFSPIAWAEKSFRVAHFHSRFHLASAYKAAIEIYASYVLGGTEGYYLSQKEHIETLIEPAIMHMISIPPDDFHIKSLVWPAFIVGAETDHVEGRQLLRGLFHQIWAASCCRNAKSACELLEILWGRTNEDKLRRTWLEYIYEEEEGWLFI